MYNLSPYILYIKEKRMAFFEFFKHSREKKYLGHGDDDSEAIKNEIESSFSELPVQGLMW